MEFQVDINFSHNTAYTLNDGIASTGGTNFEIRVTNSSTFIRFSSNVTGVTAVKKLKIDTNPNSEYYTVTIPSNGTGSSRLIKLYGFPLGFAFEDGILLFSLYQNG